MYLQNSLLIHASKAGRPIHNTSPEFLLPLIFLSLPFAIHLPSNLPAQSHLYVLYHTILDIGPSLNMPSLNLSSLPSQSSHHSSLTTEATLGVVFGICMALLAIASLWLAWVQWRFQRRNSECEFLTDMWQAC